MAHPQPVTKLTYLSSPLLPTTNLISKFCKKAFRRESLSFCWVWGSFYHLNTSLSKVLLLFQPQEINLRHKTLSLAVIVFIPVARHIIGSNCFYYSHKTLSSTVIVFIPAIRHYHLQWLIPVTRHYHQQGLFLFQPQDIIIGSDCFIQVT